MALGSTASLIGSFFYRYQDTIRKIGGILVIIFGIYLTGLMPLRFLYRERRVSFLPKTKGFLSAILMGMAFAAGWTPCISPILASILIYAGTVKTVATGAWLLAVYSLGLGVPFFLAAVLLEYFAGFHRRFSRYLPWVSRIGGVLLVVLGIMLYFDRLASLSF
ncbi:cytochrome c biogenesis protein transmembrane region [Calderihabitans maritimus]|uniref:Cytochrome c biogenesis protein transmembrane region n=1 Tax=Calderihabitans maritimus TaxID=1246530 RepID=A0A1Z5HT78_9FIRM|nr:cytochrome c biogenesis protein transmembrane region [Calderihabitans maritimus]